MFDFSHTENEQRLRREESLEKRYWEYLEFYMNALSKALQYWKESTWKNAFMVFHRVNIQQISAIQEAAEMLDLYSLAVMHDMLVVLDEHSYPSDTEEDLMVRHLLDFDDFVQSKLSKNGC